MTEQHLSPADLSTLVDGELTGAQLAAVNQHLAGCAACTAAALSQALLKTAAAKAGQQRYAMPAGFEERMRKLAQQETATSNAKPSEHAPRRFTQRTGWAAALLLVGFAGSEIFEKVQQFEQSRMQAINMVAAESRDLHIAAMAASAAPQVLSSDRHTVKPWFQGKLPFSFNLPEDLPDDVKLEGGDLVYLHNQPAAQLIYSIGKHRASVFLRQRNGARNSAASLRVEGFQVDDLPLGELELTAVSDVEASQLADLAARIQSAQQN